jgi:CubicO group peptidase (beta-lactamase class C family)
VSRPASFAEITQRFTDQGCFRGAVLRVEREGRLLHEEAWGHALLTDDERIPVTPSTIFDLASLSKLFTTTALLRLATLGTLRLDAKVAEILDLPARLTASLGVVDVRSLLAHSSGILSWYPFYAGGGTRESAPFFDLLANILAAHPRKEDVIYSDLNFMLLGLIVEETMHMALPDAVDRLVFDPLALHRTSYLRPVGPAAASEMGNRIEKRMVADLGLSFEGWRDESRPLVGEANDGNCFYYFGGAAGHAGIFSDACDLCSLGRLYVEAGRADSTAYLAPEVAEEALRDHGGGRGLGFQLGENYPPGACGHTGFTGTFLMLAAGGLVTAILTNRLHVPQPRDIGPYRREMADAVLSLYG